MESDALYSGVIDKYNYIRVGSDARSILRGDEYKYIKVGSDALYSGVMSIIIALSSCS